MSKYRILMRPGTYDTSLYPEEYETIDEAVKEAIGYGTDNFLIITIVDWEAEAKS